MKPIRSKHNEEDKKRHQELNKFTTPGKTANDMQEDLKQYHKVFDMDKSIEDLLKQSITDEEKAKEHKRKQEEFLSSLDNERKQLSQDKEAIKLFNELTKDIKNDKLNIKEDPKYKMLMQLLSHY